MTNNLVYLADRRASDWRQIFATDSESSTLQVYVNDSTGEIEVFQMNDEGEAIRTSLDATDASMFRAALALKRQKAT